MSYSFREVLTYCFDLHTSSSRLTNGNGQGAGFLADEESYSRQYAGAASDDTEGFTVRPLQPRTLLHNHFWKYYLNDQQIGRQNSWSLFLPFVCIPKNVDVTMPLPAAPYRVQVRATVFVFPFGWSSNIEVHASGELSESELVRHSRRLLDLQSSPFVIAGRAYSLSGLFGLLSAKTKHDFFGAGSNDVTDVKRHLVSSIIRCTGQAKPYRSNAAGVQMSDADRALMHSIVLGKVVDIAEYARLEREKRYFLTEFGEASFGLTYLERGTLLFLQDIAMMAGKRRSLRCLTSNVRSCSMMLLALVAFRRALRKLQIPAHAALDESAVSRLRLLGYAYQNPICRGFYRSHAGLREYIA